MHFDAFATWSTESLARNGWPVLMGICAASVAGEARQTQVLGLIFATGSGTQLVGPAVGGWTYGAVRSFPALVPSAIGCGLVLLALALFANVEATEPQAVDTSPKVRKRGAPRHLGVENENGPSAWKSKQPCCHVVHVKSCDFSSLRLDVIERL